MLKQKLNLVIAITATMLTSQLVFAKGEQQVNVGELPVEDQEFACISQADANRYVKDYNINVASFGGMELCDGSKDTKKLFNDLTIIEKGQFEGKDSNMFIRGFVNQNQYYAWMKGETNGVRRGHDIPYATAYNSGGYFTMQDGWSKLSTLGRVGTIIHEARHTAGYGHRQCVFGPYSDVSIAGCDRNVAEGGSHGVEMEYYSRVILQGKNFHPVYKAMARMMNLGRSNFVFNENPMQKSEMLLARAQNHTHLVTSQGVTVNEVPNIQNFRLKRTSFGASLFNGEQAYALDIHSGGHHGVKIVDDFSYYKLLNRPDTDLRLIDLEEVDLGVKRQLVGLNDRGQVLVYDFRKGDWSKNMLNADGVMLAQVAPNGQKGIFVIKKDQSICSLNPAKMTCTAIKESWPQNIVSFVVMNNQLLELTADGQVRQSLDKSLVSDLSGVAVEDFISVPVYNAFNL